MLCVAADCDADSATTWQRWATDDEIAQYKASGDLPPSETSALLMICACPLHAIAPDLAAVNHDATCTAPPTCDCSVSGGVGE